MGRAPHLIRPCAAAAHAASHTALVLLEHGAKVTLLDNLSNSFMRVLEHMKKLAGAKAGSMSFVQVGGSAGWARRMAMAAC